MSQEEVLFVFAWEATEMPDDRVQWSHAEIRWIETEPCRCKSLQTGSKVPNAIQSPRKAAAHSAACACSRNA